MSYLCMAIIRIIAYLNVTQFWKTDQDVTFGISRNTDFKYSSHCSSLVLDCSHARYMYCITATGF